MKTKLILAAFAAVFLALPARALTLFNSDWNVTLTPDALAVPIGNAVGLGFSATSSLDSVAKLTVEWSKYNTTTGHFDVLRDDVNVPQGTVDTFTIISSATAAEYGVTASFLRNGSPVIESTGFYVTPATGGVANISAATPAPEPCAFTTMLGGFGLLYGRRRRR